MKVDLVNINKIKNSLLSFSCLITAVPHSNYVNHLVLRTGVAHSPYRYTVAPQFFCVPGASVTFAKHLHWHLNPLPPRTHPNPTPGVEGKLNISREWFVGVPNAGTVFKERPIIGPRFN